MNAAPQRGPTRQQRSAMISKEVEMLQRDRPHPTFNNPDTNTLRPPGAGQTIDPEAIGMNVGGGRMGENDLATQEGPLAQGVNIRARTDVEAGADTRAARGTGQPVTLDDAAERGESGMEPGRAEMRDERVSRPPSEEAEDDATTHQLQEATRRSHLVQLEEPSRNELLLGQNGSTIAASNFEAVIEERLRGMTEPGISELDSHRRHEILAQKFRRGQLVRFESVEEKAAVLEIAKNAARRRRKSSNGVKPSSEDESPDAGVVQPAPRVYNFTPLPANVQTVMIDKIVRGRYDIDGSLHGDKYKQTVLNNVANATTMNSTYLAGDGERLLKKVRSLLPAATTPAQQRQGQGQSQSAKAGR